jgi:hypothetical protein
MDSSHKLEAPNNEELKTIEQIEDKSGLTTLYREPGQQFEGEILSAEDRDKSKAEKLEAITSGIGKSALKIGLYIPYPFISGLLLAVIIYTTIDWANALILIALVILSIGAWALTSYFAYAAIFKSFYKHALRAGPFLFVSLISVLLASQAAYGFITHSFATQSLLFNAALISLLIVIYSIIINYILLGIWGNSKLGSGIKAAVSGLVIVVSSFLVAVIYLF